MSGTLPPRVAQSKHIPTRSKYVDSVDFAFLGEMFFDSAMCGCFFEINYYEKLYKENMYVIFRVCPDILRDYFLAL